MKVTKIVCYNCGEECEKSTKEINRQIKKGRTQFYCSLNCSSSKIHTTTTKLKSNCLWCKNEFETTTHKQARKCCSLDCARKYSQSFVKWDDEMKLKASNITKKLWDVGIYGAKHPPILHDFICVICGNMFQKITDNWEYKNNPRKTCSKKCYTEHNKQWTRNNPNCGGETGYRHYKYKNIWMDSNWEVEIAKLLDFKNIKWERDRKKHMFWWTDKDGNKRRYYPDFYLPEYDVYLDPKNKYKMLLDKEKMESVLKENKIKLSWGLLENVKKDIDNLKSGDIVIHC